MIGRLPPGPRSRRFCPKKGYPMRFSKPFRGATGGEAFPRDFAPGEDCPDDLIAAAMEADALETAPLPEGAGDVKGRVS